MSAQLRRDFKRFLYDGPIISRGTQAEYALRNAKTLARWRELEDQGLVRLRAEPEEENYFDVFGKPDDEKEYKAICESLDTYGNYWCVAEYWSTCSCGERGEWEQADSIGMCAGYKNVLDPFENCYIVDLMAEAIEKAESELED